MDRATVWERDLSGCRLRIKEARDNFADSTAFTCAKSSCVESINAVSQDAAGAAKKLKFLRWRQLRSSQKIRPEKVNQCPRINKLRCCVLVRRCRHSTLVASGLSTRLRALIFPLQCGGEGKLSCKNCVH